MSNSPEQQNCITSAHACSRDSIAYWRQRVYRPVCVRDGCRIKSVYWAVQIQCHGLRKTLSLSTPDKGTAATKARDIYLRVRAEGWPAVLEVLRPASAPIPFSVLSVGEFLTVVGESNCDIEHRTIQNYASALRTVLAEAFNVDPEGRFDALHGGNARWRARIDVIKLVDITPTIIQQWKRSALDKAGNDPMALRSARETVTSHLRRIKSLFSKKVLRHLTAITLPDPVPFSGVQYEKRQNVRYRSGFDAVALLTAARDKLPVNDPEGFKIFLLALTAGLRAHEIDLLEWDAFDFAANTLTIQPTRYYQPKSEYSLGAIDLEPELVEIFRGFRARAHGNFVIESSLPPKITARYDYYRCRPCFDRIYAWLRAHGISGRKPLHTLRKEYGSQVCDRHGIYAASRALRHATVATTAAHYLDKKSKVTSGLGAVFSDRVIEFKKAQGA
jgi:integrase